MRSFSNLTYGFAGLGLMGGSLAKAIRAKLLDSASARGKILAMDSNMAALASAMEKGVVDEVFEPEAAALMLKRCDIVFVCLYPAKTIDFLKEYRADFKSGAVVSDISGVKTGIMRSLPDILRGDVDFICGHPMAGSEKEGFYHSSEYIFEGRNYILMPHLSNKPENILFFKGLIGALGFSRITETDYELHDHKIAFTSQLCHVIASALVESAEDAEITAFGGGSFEDLTRIAMINAPLWTELFLANRAELLAHIDAFKVSLEKITDLIRDADGDGLCGVLEAVRVKRTAMSTIELTK
ncbi:MAG: prephenate dehydrogenase [Spirochaetaceae bacterium]|jgi:prephenate dehydrogenase|nr:prephenate dehydrogenase [Spirochaetaceae bacterium]